MKPIQNSRADNMTRLEKSMGPTPGLETPVTSDEADVLDAGDGVQGLGVGGLRRPRRVIVRR
jgi:hypothetical protein